MSEVNSLHQTVIIEEDALQHIKEREGKRKRTPAGNVLEQQRMTINMKTKNVTIAKLLAFIVPGLGLIYLNKVGLGLRYFFTVVLLYTAHIYLGGLNVLPVYESHAVSFFFLNGTLITWATSILSTSASCERYNRMLIAFKEHLQSKHGIIANH